MQSCASHPVSARSISPATLATWRGKQAQDKRGPVDVHGATRSSEQSRPPHSSHRSTTRIKTASEQSSPKTEKSSRNLCEVMKRNAGFMAKSLCDDADRAAFLARLIRWPGPPPRTESDWDICPWAADRAETHFPLQISRKIGESQPSSKTASDGSDRPSSNTAQGSMSSIRFTAERFIADALYLAPMS